jgi:hypothetical protein
MSLGVHKIVAFVIAHRHAKRLFTITEIYCSSTSLPSLRQRSLRCSCDVHSRSMPVVRVRLKLQLIHVAAVTGDIATAHAR